MISQKLSRLLSGAVALSLALIGSVPAVQAQDTYPNKPIELIVGYLAGGATDFAARVVADALTAKLGQPVVVVNKAGAASAIAVDYVAHAKADGYTLLFGNADAITILPAVKANVPFKIPESLTFVSKALQYPLAFGIRSQLPIKTMQEFVDYAKANPGKLTYGSSGVGGALHIEALLMAQAAGIDIVHVAYKGAAGAITDLVGGSIDSIFLTVRDIMPQVKAGNIRLLAVSSAERDPTIADIPTLAEVGLGGATMAGWFGVMGPAGLPNDIRDKLSSSIAEVLAEPAVKDRLSSTGLYNSVIAGDAFRDFVVKEYQQYKTLADRQHIQVTD